MNRARLDTVIEISNAILYEGGFLCIEAEWEPSQRILRLFVDHAERIHGGMNLDECVKATKLLDVSPELEGVISGPFTLEVSSPGVERPLRRLEDFERYVGHMADVKLSEKHQDRKHGKGRIVEVSASEDKDTFVTLDTQRGSWQFPLASLQRASLVYDWGNS